MVYSHPASYSSLQPRTFLAWFFQGSCMWKGIAIVRPSILLSVHSCSRVRSWIRASDVSTLRLGDFRHVLLHLRGNKASMACISRSSTSSTRCSCNVTTHIGQEEARSRVDRLRWCGETGPLFWKTLSRPEGGKARGVRIPGWEGSRGLGGGRTRTFPWR